MMLRAKLARHLRVFGIAFVFAMLAYGLVHLLYWLVQMAGRVA